MTREEKIEKRKRRAKFRREKRMKRYVERIKQARSNNIPYYVPLSAIRYGGSWTDSKSSTGYYQICDYFGICESPCNGDC